MRCRANDRDGHLCESEHGHDSAHSAVLNGITHWWDWDGDRSQPDALTAWVGLLDCGHSVSGRYGTPPEKGDAFDCPECNITSTLVDVIASVPRPA